MYNKPTHILLASMLESIDHKAALIENDIYFAGGTSIALLHKEIRESVDLDFIANLSGFSAIREILKNDGFEYFFPGQKIGKTFFYRDAARGYVNDVKVEFIEAENWFLQGEICRFGIPALAPQTLLAEKLTANSDRWADRSVYFKDIIDIGILLQLYPGALPDAAEQAVKRYGKSVSTDYQKALYGLAKNWQSTAKILQIPIDTMKDIIKTIRDNRETVCEAARQFERAQFSQVNYTGSDESPSPTP